MPEKILLLSLRILRELSRTSRTPDQRALRIIEWNREREDLLKNLDMVAVTSPADLARLEIISLLNKKIRSNL